MFQPIFHSLPVLTALCVLGAAVIVWLAPRREGRKRWRFAFWRLVTLGLLAWILARPMLRTTETETFPGSVLLLTDTSRSMQVRDETSPGGASCSRFDAMCRALGDSQAALDTLAAEVRVSALEFDRDVRAVSVSDGALDFPEAPTGTQTAIGAALSDALRESAGQKILGVALFTDGAQRATAPRDTLPQTVVSRMKRLQIPLYAVPFGSVTGASRSEDVAVEDFWVEPRVFVRTEVVASGRVRLQGVPGREITVETTVQHPDASTASVVDRLTLRTEKDVETLPVTLAWTPEVPGEFKVALRAAIFPGEISDANNELGAFVNVVEGGVRVLFIEGAYRPEMSFLRRAWEAEDEIRLDSVVLTAREQGRRPLDLLETLDANYAVIVLGDVNVALFRAGELEKIVEKVNAGAGLLTLGGLGNYGAGGFAESALADVLPVRMDRLERRLPTEPPAPKAHWDTPLRFTPTQVGMGHFALAQDRDAAASGRIWAALPPLDGANRFPEGLKPGAVVLAVGVPEKGAGIGPGITPEIGPEARGIPLLVEHPYGSGRVTTFTADSSWRWWMAGFQEAHKRFWCQLVLWLAKKENALDGNVALLMPQRRFTQDQSAPFHLTARLSSGENLVSEILRSGTRGQGGTQAQGGTQGQGGAGLWAGWRAELEHPDGRRTAVGLVPERDALAGEVPPGLPPGDYTLHASVTHAGQKIGDAQCRFLVYHHDWELDNVQSEPELLGTLAAMTGGRVVERDGLAELWDTLGKQREELKITREIAAPVWDRAWWMLLLLALLCTEWFFRKRDGLL